MAKKSRRTRIKSPRKVSGTTTNPPVEAVPAEPADGSPEYAYVIANLRQVAILAAAMFVLLIGLSFFIG